MNEELEVYSDTDKLKKSLEEKRKLLIAEREKILGTRDASKANLEKLQAEVGFICFVKFIPQLHDLIFGLLNTPNTLFIHASYIIYP